MADGVQRFKQPLEITIFLQDVVLDMVFNDTFESAPDFAKDFAHILVYFFHNDNN